MMAMRVFKISECDWFMAETPSQAREAAIEFYGDADYLLAIDQIEEVSAAEMKRLKVKCESDAITRTFESQLAKLIKEGATDPELFASTEY